METPQYDPNTQQVGVQQSTSRKKTLLLWAVAGLVVIFGALAFFQYYIKDKIGTESISTTDLRELIELAQYKTVVDEGLQVLNLSEPSTNIDEPTLLSVAKDVVLAAGRGQKVSGAERTSEEDFVATYSILYKLAKNDSYSNLFRSSIYAQMNKLFQYSSLNTEWLVEGVKRFDGGNTYALYENTEWIDTEYSIAYTALYKMNEEAENLYPDKFNRAWQSWIVGLSMIDSPPPPELEDQFINYMQNKLAQVRTSSHETIESVFQSVWIEQALLTVSVELAKQYPNELVIDKNQISVDFERLLNTLELNEVQGNELVELGFQVRLAYASFLLNSGAPTTQIDQIIQPFTGSTFVQRAPETAAWISSGQYKGVSAEYLLQDLYTISLQNETLRASLISLGWKYDS